MDVKPWLRVVQAREPVTHPVTGKQFDYNQICGTCVHFTDRRRTVRGTQYRTTRCALDPERRNLADTKGTSWSAVPACTDHQRLAN